MTASAAADPRFAPDGRYAWLRLGLSLILGTTACVGTWSVVVVLPAVQAEFGTLRAGASMPYTCAMFGFAAGSILMGRLSDRKGITVPILIGACALLAGYMLAAWSPNIWVFAAAHLFLIGFGAAAGFAPLMADLSHWFVKNRGLAVVMAATGSYAAGTVWPQIISQGMAAYGWRVTHMGIGIACFCIMLPLAFALRRRPSAQAFAAAEKATLAARGDIGMSSRTLMLILFAAGFSCCAAMAMPQVHIVAYCGDLGYGVARGADMLSLMLALGIVSRIVSGFVADRIGGVATLLIGSGMQAAALFLYLWFDGLSSLFIISGIFGLFQGGIVPMYAVIIREYMPPREAASRIGIVMTATMMGMAFGGWFSGAIFDLFASYRMAFLNGLIWNMVNIALVAFLLLRPRLKVGAGTGTAAA
jgi:MFS family permease